MTRSIKIGIFLLLIPIFLWAQQKNSSALFVPNQGQWEGDFHYRLQINNGFLFFGESGYTMLFNDPEQYEHKHSSHSEEHGLNKKASSPEDSIPWFHAIDVKFLYANAFPDINGSQKADFYHNYFLGKDASQWRSEVPVYHDLVYRKLYPGIDVHFGEKNNHLKYDFKLAPGAEPRLIQMQYGGADNIYLKENRLYIETRFGKIHEFIPEAYQFINGEKIEVMCRYKLVNNIVKFSLGNYNPGYELIIDPELVFSSYTGSPAPNWGFTATYDDEGNLYGGGIAFNMGQSFPVTTGAFQENFQGSPGTSFSNSDVDITISKFSATGDQLRYSTFIGGNGIDLPHSLVVGDNNNLYILGVTASEDYPVSPGAFQTAKTPGTTFASAVFRFVDGSDLVISKLSADGTSMEASTFYGGEGKEGVNKDIYLNYGDDSRGEIIYKNNNVFIVSNTASDSLLLQNPYIDSLGGGQDALIASFTNDLSALNWATYYGGSNDDVGYSIKSDGQGNIFVGGSTRSSDFPVGSLGYKSNYSGNLDGFLAKFDESSGAFITATFIGSGSADQLFLLDIDRSGAVYGFGRSAGDISQSPGLYSNPLSRQFVKKFKNDLSDEIWSTRIGSGQAKYDLVPTAFLVDDCYNIFLSGWNGESNQVSPTGQSNGDTEGLPVTDDAFQQNTDGSDFYFMVLGRDAQNLVYASYFGGTASEHVDGGTSRFDPHGTIYQAVCAGCYGLTFPTTPGVVSETNESSNCNLGAVKINFEVSVQSRPAIDMTADLDTVCDTLFVQFTNESINAQLFEWDFGNGENSTEEEPFTFFSEMDTYEIRLIATDTNCGISDTSYLTLVHDSSNGPKAGFEVDYEGCQSQFQAAFTNTSEEASEYHWDFGDGSQSTEKDPAHIFENGKHFVTLTATDTFCDKSVTYSDTVYYTDTIPPPEVMARTSDCSDGSVEIELVNDRNRYIYEWNFGDGRIIKDKKPAYRYETPGTYLIHITITDTVCNDSFEIEYAVTINQISRETFIPNAFTPNGDIFNEEFIIYGNSCDGNTELRIFNRWGQEVFRSDRPFNEFWDANQNGQPAPEGVYTYSLTNGEEVIRGTILLIR